MIFFEKNNLQNLIVYLRRYAKIKKILQIS